MSISYYRDRSSLTLPSSPAAGLLFTPKRAQRFQQRERERETLQSLLPQKNKTIRSERVSERERERERERREMGAAVGGVILDESVLLGPQHDDDLHANSSVQSGAESLLRKLRHSKIRVVFHLSPSLELDCSWCNILLLPFWVFFF
jgi:hypothetical protein